MKNPGYVCFLSLFLLGTTLSAQADTLSPNVELGLYRFGLMANQRIENDVADCTRKYLLSSLPVAEAGRGVSEVALVTQTEPDEIDSVYNIGHGSYQDPDDEAVPESPIRHSGNYFNTYKSNKVKHLHSTASIAYFGSMGSAIMLPNLMTLDNSFEVGFSAETKKNHGTSSYGLSLSYSRKLSDKLRFSVDWSPLTWDTNGAGFDNASIDFQYNLFHNPSNSMSARLSASFPSGSPSYSGVGIEPTFQLSYSKKLSSKWALTFNAGIANNNDSNHGPSYANIKYGVQLGNSFDGNNYIGYTFGGKNRDKIHDGVSTNYVQVFYSHNFDERNSMSFGVKKGLSYASTDWALSTSYAFNF